MSSRSKRKGGGQKYPTPWGEWGWSEKYQRSYRSRLKGPDDWEYEYAQPDNQPRKYEEPSLGPSAPENYSQEEDYTTRPADPLNVESLTQDFAGASISPGGGTYTSGTYPSASSSGAYSGATNTGFSPAATSTGTYSGVAGAGYAAGQTFGQPSYAAPTTDWQPHIQTRDPYTDKEAFDPHYKVHKGWAFKFGRIFKVLWAEPKGEGAGSAGHSGTQSETVRKGPGGENTFRKVRRFVIINAMEGHCICLPIMTYSGQGVNKSGVHAKHHAIIYSGKKPIALRGEREKGLRMKSIKVTPDNPRHKLDDASRLNYAKCYTVEYNVKVWFIGKVSSESEWQLQTDYNHVHPPLEIKGIPPPDMPEDTYEHTEGGTGGGYYSSGSYPSASYSSGSPYPQNTSYASPATGYSTAPYPSYNVHETIPEHEHEQESSSTTYQSYDSPPGSANAPYGDLSTGYDAGAYAANATAYSGPGTTAAGGYGSGSYGEGDERDYGREHRHGRRHGRGESGSDPYHGGNSRQSGSGTGGSSYGSGTGGPDYIPSTGYEHMDPLAENPQWGDPEAEVPPQGSRRDPSRPRKRGKGPAEHGNIPPDDHRDLYEE